MMHIRDDLNLEYFRKLSRTFAFLCCGVSGLLCGMTASHLGQDLPRQVFVLEAIMMLVSLIVIVVTSKRQCPPDT
jgi:hypothetical protein